MDSEPNSPSGPTVTEAKLTTIGTPQPTNLTTITPMAREHVNIIPLSTTTSSHSIVRVGTTNPIIRTIATPTIRTISTTTPLQKVTLNNGANTPITVVASGSTIPGGPKTYHVVMPVTTGEGGQPTVKKLKTEFESPHAVRL